MESQGIFTMVFVQAIQEHLNPVFCPTLSLEDHQRKCVHRESKAKEPFLTG